MTIASDTTGRLIKLEYCWLKIPSIVRNGRPKGYPECVKFRAMPTITDSKGARYNDEPIIGRSQPLVTYSHSENRIITLDIPFIATDYDELIENIRWMRAIESATYPNHDSFDVPYVPPPVCKLHCGAMFDGKVSRLPKKNARRAFASKECVGRGVCVVLEKYSMKYDPAVPVDPVLYIPYSFVMATTWRVVYKPNDLPGQTWIAQHGS